MMLNGSESSADIHSAPPPTKMREEEGKAWEGRAESPAAKRAHVEEGNDGREGAGPLLPLPSVSSPSTNAPPPTIPPPLTTTPLSSSSSSPPFTSPFSTANLFGLFERIANGTVDPNFGIGAILPSAEIAPHSQQQTFKTNSSALAMDELTTLSLGINGGQRQQQNQQTPATIDKLLQISQQFLSGRTEPYEEMGKRNGQKRTTNGGNGVTTPRGEENNGTEREGTAKGGGGGTRGANNGGGDGRKRSYPYTFQFCVLCQKNVHSSKLPCHIRQCHVGKPMFQCPVCDFTSTYSKNNVKSHMVSLHGLAGDPISYMDQYATQVEEFMKQCFPNVRGRGRPLHGRQSPNAKQQQIAMSTTVTNSARAKPTVAPPLAIGQSQSSSPMPNAGPSPQHRTGGRQQRATTKSIQPQQSVEGQPMMVVGRADAAQCLPPFSVNNATDGAALLPFGVTDVYGAAMGMLKTTTAANQRTTTSLLPNGDGCGGGGEGSLFNFGKGMAFGPPLQRDNGFLSTFNPFIYLQQLNNLFAVNSANSNAQHQHMATKALGDGDGRFKMETDNELDVTKRDESPHQQRLNTSLFSLEDCLNLSQKFLKEMNKDEEQRTNETNGEANDGKLDAPKELLICHSSSPTASPHPSGCFPTSAANATTEMDRIRREQNRSFDEEAEGQSTAATTPNASRRPSNSSAAAAVSGSVEDELAKIKAVLRQHERRIRLLEDQLADTNMANAYGL